jgi:O-antigen/teichoic acid export membrane protein
MFFLLPLYTRYLSPADYGIVGIALTISSVLGILLPLGLQGALTQIYFAAPDVPSRRRDIGTLWTAIALFATGMTLLMDRFGQPLFSSLLREIPFSPHVRLTLWSALFGVLGLLTLNLVQLQERPGLYVVLTVASAVLTVGAILERVVHCGLGALGYLQGTAAAAGVMVVPLTVFFFANARPAMRSGVLKSALAYGLPLLPHGLASWTLGLSDRLILERYVPMSEVGLFQLGAQLASALTIAAQAVNTAWLPFLFRTHKERGLAAAPELARLVTYYAFMLVWVDLGLVLLCRHAILLLASSAYQPASRVIPWLSAGLLLNGLYLIPVSFLFLTSRTRWIPLGTIASGAVAVGLNLLLVPRWGVLAPGWSSIAGNLVLLAIIWAAARRAYPLPYEYGRIGILLASGAALFGVGACIRLESPLLEGALRAAVWLAFPPLLAVLGFFTPAERGRIRKLLGLAEGAP